MFRLCESILAATILDKLFRLCGLAREMHTSIAYEYVLMKSAARSPIIMQVRLVLAWATVGMIEASPIQRFSMP